MSKPNASPPKSANGNTKGAADDESQNDNTAFKLGDRAMTVSSNASRPGTPQSPRPLSPTKPLTGGKAPVVTLGVCAMDVKARSKAMREILTRLVDIEKGGVDVQIFGDVVILEEGECLSSLSAPSHSAMHWRASCVIMALVSCCSAGKARTCYAAAFEDFTTTISELH